MKFFQVREKAGNFVDGQGNFKRTWKVRDFENKRVWQSSENLFILFMRGSMYFLKRKS